MRTALIDDEVATRVAEDEEDERIRRNPWFRLAIFILAGVLAVAVTLTWLSLVGDTQPDPQPLERSSFTDMFGRQCTQVRAGEAVALDCDYKPVESRLGSLLEGTQP